MQKRNNFKPAVELRQTSTTNHIQHLQLTSAMIAVVVAVVLRLAAYDAIRNAAAWNRQFLKSPQAAGTTTASSLCS